MTLPVLSDTGRQAPATRWHAGAAAPLPVLHRPMREHGWAAASLSRAAAALLDYCADRADPASGVLTVTLPQAGRRLGYTERHMRRARDECEAAGALVVLVTGGWRGVGPVPSRWRLSKTWLAGLADATVAAAETWRAAIAAGLRAKVAAARRVASPRVGGRRAPTGHEVRPSPLRGSSIPADPPEPDTQRPPSTRPKCEHGRHPVVCPVCRHSPVVWPLPDNRRYDERAIAASPPRGL